MPNDIVTPMRTTGYFVNGNNSRILSLWQLLFAGLYAFVLPFICAGAQATPGHPHARAHFVFAEPELVDQKSLSTVNHNMVRTSHGSGISIGEHEAECFIHHAHGAATAEQLPVGRSVPMQMVISGLIPVGAVASMMPLLADVAGFSVWLADSIVAPFLAPVPTPPPR